MLSMSPTSGSSAPHVQQQSLPSIEDLLRTAKRHLRFSQFEEAIQGADQVLAIAPGNEEALRCKYDALISTRKFNEARSVLRDWKPEVVHDRSLTVVDFLSIFGAIGYGIYLFATEPAACQGLLFFLSLWLSFWIG